MSANLERISAIWRDQSSAYIEQLTDDILANAGPSYAKIQRDQMLPLSRRVVDAWQTALDTTTARRFANSPPGSASGAPNRM